MNPLTLVLGPATAVVTATVTVQLPLAGIVPPEKLRDVLPLVGVHVPPQVVEAPVGFATVIPEGRSSVKLALVSAIWFGLVSVKVSEDVPLAAMTLGVNALVSVGCCGVPQPVNVTSSM